MSDDTYHDSAPSFSSPIASPNRTTSPGLDYEQSQHKQPARDAREAAMSAEELAEAARSRDLKRTRLYYEYYGELPVKNESSSPPSIPRSTAVEANHIMRYATPFKICLYSCNFSGLFAPGAILDSQTGSQAYINSLLSRDESQMHPEAAETQLEDCK